MKLKKLLLSVLMLLSISGLQAQSLSPSTQIHWDKGTLVIKTPERPTDQQHVLGLTAPKMEPCVWLLWAWVCAALGRCGASATSQV